MAQSGLKVHGRFISKCHQRRGGNDEDKNNSNKKSAKLEKKIHWSMKRGKMIKMVATGTGARKSRYWRVALSWSWGFLLQASLQTSILGSLHRLACAWEKRKRASCSLVAPAGADIQGSWVGVGVGMLTVQAGGGPSSLRQGAANGGVRLTGSLLIPSPYTHTHTPLVPHRCLSLQCDELTVTHDPEGWELWLQLGRGWVSQTMAHHSFQIKPEPQDKQGHCQQLGGLGPSP